MHTLFFYIKFCSFFFFFFLSIHVFSQTQSDSLEGLVASTSVKLKEKVSNPDYLLEYVSDTFQYDSIRKNIVRTKIENSYCYVDKSSPKDLKNHAFYIYLKIEEKNQPELYLRIQYAADDWLLIKRMKISADDNIFWINKKYFEEFKTDKTNGKKWEWMDRKVDKEEYELVKSLANSTTSQIFFYGLQFNNYRSITPCEKRALKHMLKIYELVGGSLK